MEAEKENQLDTLSSDLLQLQGSILRERNRVLVIIQERDRVIDAQKKEIEMLKRQNKLLEGKGRSVQKMSETRSKPNNDLSYLPRVNQDFPPYLQGTAESSSRSLEDLDKCAKPPVPSRDGVNRKLHIGGAPPPPPPRGVSLPEKVSQKRSNDTKNVTFSSFSRDSKNEEKFDSGRESDETFDNESIKSTEMATSPSFSLDSSDSFSPETIFSQKRNLMKESVVNMDNKTKVTFWTDTYF